jgi:hypothetical protein
LSYSLNSLSDICRNPSACDDQTSVYELFQGRFDEIEFASRWNWEWLRLCRWKNQGKLTLESWILFSFLDILGGKFTRNHQDASYAVFHDVKTEGNEKSQRESQEIGGQMFVSCHLLFSTSSLLVEAIILITCKVIWLFKFKFDRIFSVTFERPLATFYASWYLSLFTLVNGSRKKCESQQMICFSANLA